MNFQYKDNLIYVLDDHDKIIVEATFPFIKDKVVNINHTFVDSSLRGKGIASQLMNVFYDYVKKMGYKVVATCPYAVMWFERNKDKHDVLLNIDLNHAQCEIR